MKFLVTGGAGFIGSNIVKALIDKGHSVRVLDLREGALRRLGVSMNDVDFIRGDIRDTTLDAAVRGVDGIFHEAALVSVQESYKAKEEYHSVNVNGTRNVLDMALKHNVRVVHASSASIYGNVSSVPISENTPRSSNNPYGNSKIDAELLIQKHMVENSVGIIGLRYFNVYGEGQNAGVILQFMKRLKNGLSPIINGNGLQSRDFVHVKDVADANLAAMFSKNNGFFNVGTGKSITINKLAQIMIRAYTLEMEPEHIDSGPGDVKESRADIAKTAKRIPWKYSIELDYGLSKLCTGDMRP